MTHPSDRQSREPAADGGSPTSQSATIDSDSTAPPSTAAVDETTDNSWQPPGLVDERIRQIRAVATTEYRLGIRSRWALALTGLFTVFSLMILTFSGSAVGPEGVERVVASLMSLAIYLVPLAAVAFGYDMIVGRQQEGWLDIVFALPVTRARVTLGSYIGRLIVLSGALSIGFGVAGILLLREFGVVYWNSFVVFLGATVALGAVFLAIALTVSTVAPTPTHALGGVLGVWVWFVLIHDLLALGVVAAISVPDWVLSVFVLLNPTSIFRLLVLGSLETTASGGAAALDASGLTPAVLVGALGVWMLLPVGAAMGLISYRQL